MRVRALLVVFVAFACTAGACSLNPQPLPPGTYDGSAAGLDSGKGGTDATAFGDVGAPPIEDASADGSPNLQEDGGDAASDAEVDGEVDASDAATDAPDDAPDGD